MALRSVNPIKRFLNIAGLLSGLGLGPVHPALGGRDSSRCGSREESSRSSVVASGIGDAIAVTGLRLIDICFVYPGLELTTHPFEAVESASFAGRCLIPPAAAIIARFSYQTSYTSSDGVCRAQFDLISFG